MSVKKERILALAVASIILFASANWVQAGITTTNFTADGGAYDGSLTKAAATWAQVDAASPIVDTSSLLDEASRANTPTYAMKRRGYLSVNTSSIPDDALVTNATLLFYVNATFGDPNTTFYSGENCFDTLDADDWNNCTTNEGNMTNFQVGAFNAKSILPSSVSKTTLTQFRLVQANESIEPPLGLYLYMRWASGDAPKAGHYKLEVTYETNDPPRVTITSPSNGSWKNYRNINFTFTPQEDAYATGGSFKNCSLILWWTNGTLLASQLNQSNIVNNSPNYINYTFASDGAYLWNVECYDNATNPLSGTAPANFTLNVDATPPSAIAFIYPTPANNSNLSQTYFYANVSFTEANPDSCLLERNATNYTATRIGTTCYYNSTGLSDGEYWYKMWVNDSAGNWNVSVEQKVFLDTVAPSTTSNYSSNNSWVNANQTISLSCSDSAPATGCRYTWYCTGIGCSNWSIYSAPLNYGEGITNLFYKSEDYAGNNETLKQNIVKIDLTPPSTTSNASSINNTWVNYDVTVNLTSTDSLSGVQYTWYCIGAASCTNWTVYSAPITFTSETTNYVRYFAQDNAGNNESIKDNWIKIDKTPPTLSFVSPNYPTGQVFNDTQAWVPVNASFVELNADSCILDWNGTNQSFAPTGNYCWVNKTAIAAYGNYSYAVYLNDSAGNYNWSGTRWAYAELCRTLSANYLMVGNASKIGSTCFVLGASSVSLNCSNNAVIGNATAGTYGVLVNGSAGTSANASVLNCVVTNFSTGVYVYNSSGVRVLSVNASYNSQHGIFLNASSNATISSSVFSQNTLNGLYFFNSSNNAVSGVTASGNNNSAVLNASSNNSFSGNNFVSSSYYGAWLVSSNSSNFSGDNFSYSNFTGVFFDNSWGNEFVNLALAGNYSSPSYKDVNLTSASNVSFLNASFNKSSVAFGDSASNLSIKWFLNVLVTDQYGTAIAGAFVNISDYNNTLLFTGYTQSNGYIAQAQNVTEYIQNSSGNTSFTPHAIYAVKNPVGFAGTIVNESKTVTVVLGMSYGRSYFEPPPAPSPQPSPQPSPAPTATPGGGRTEEPSPTPTPRPSPTAAPPEKVTIEGKTVNASLVEKTVVAAEEKASACVFGNTSVLEITRQTRILEVRKEGGVIDYYTQVILFVRNKGAALLLGIKVTEDIPLGLISKTVFSQKPARVEGSRVTWLIDSLAPGDTKEIDYVIKQRVEASAFKTPEASAREVVYAGIEAKWFYALAATLAALAAAATYFLKRWRRPSLEKQAR